MDWIRQLNAMMDYIEENLRGEIAPGEIARIACCPAGSFQRMFSYMADQPLSDYIRSRRLTQAAFDLMQTDARVLDVALDYGYESQDAFSRAFKRFHGVLPSQARQKGVTLRSVPPLRFQMTVTGQQELRYRREHLPAFRIAGFGFDVDLEGAFGVIPGLWKTVDLAALDGLYTGALPQGYIGAADSRGGCERMKYVIGVTRPEAEPPVPGLCEIALPEADWVVFNADGRLPQAVQDVYRRFYAQWLPGSGRRLSDLPILECYHAEEKQEVWVALEPAQA